MKKTIEVEPGTNHFRIVGVQQFGTVEPKEHTKLGWPKNTVTELAPLYIFWNPETGTWSITVCQEV